jgi:hypothetical protein
MLLSEKAKVPDLSFGNRSLAEYAHKTRTHNDPTRNSKVYFDMFAEDPRFTYRRTSVFVEFRRMTEKSEKKIENC